MVQPAVKHRGREENKEEEERRKGVRGENGGHELGRRCFSYG